MIFLFLATLGAQAAEYSLPPTVIEAPPLEALSYDPLLPEDQSKVGTRGSLSSEWRARSPLPLNDYGRAGTLAQFRGYGRTADDTSVQTLGVPLNPPQGGGENLAIFPPFLWSSSRFQAGAASTPLDPLASSGALTLDLWSAAAVRSRASMAEISQHLSGELQQTALGWSGASEQNALALRVGLSLGNARGYSGSLSARRSLGAQGARVQFHLLTTDLEEKSEGSRSFPTPGASTRTLRTMPVLEWSSDPWKASIFVDVSRRDYKAGTSSTTDQPVQGGAQFAYLTPDWTFGLSGRATHYRGSSIGEVRESTGAIVGARRFNALSALMEVGAGVRPRFSSRSSTQLAPMANAGARWEGASRDVLYARAGWTTKLASLSDRFYSIAGYFEPNPSLGTEETSSLLVGWEKPISERVTQRLETLYQHKRALHLLSSIGGGKYQVRNVDSADLLHARYKLQAEFGAFALSSDLLFSSTQVGATGNALAYSPAFTHRLRAGWTQQRWSFGTLLRTQTSVRTSSGRTLGGHGLWDWEAAYALRAAPVELEMSLTLENTLNREVEWIEDYRAEGRRVTLGLVARL